MRSEQDRSERYPGRSDQRDHARIRRRYQDELPRHAPYQPLARVGGSQGNRLLGFPVSHEARPIGPFRREYGGPATRLLVQLVWIYAATAERALPQPDELGDAAVAST